MTSVGTSALMKVLHEGANCTVLPGSLMELSVGSGLRGAVSLTVLALLWWPFIAAAAAGAWLAFAKAGRPGWACLVPVYNGVEFLRVAKLPASLWGLFLVPVANLILFAAACARVARAFGKGPRFAAGLALLPPVYMAILGMGPARYRRFEVIEGAAEEPRSPPRGRSLRAASSKA